MSVSLYTYQLGEVSIKVFHGDFCKVQCIEYNALKQLLIA